MVQVKCGKLICFGDEDTEINMDNIDAVCKTKDKLYGSGLVIFCGRFEFKTMNLKDIKQFLDIYHKYISEKK